MGELTQNIKLKRSGKPFPLKNLISRCNSKKESNPGPSLGSGIRTPVVVNSIVKHNDPYMPHKSTQRSSSTSLPCLPEKQTMGRVTNSSTPQLVTHRSRQSGPDVSHYPTTVPMKSPLYHSYHSSSSHLPPLSPPPLSPTCQSFATSVRPTWRDMQRLHTYHPASSISSTDDSGDEVDDDDDDDQPLGLSRSSRPFSPLSDASEDGDDDLVPIARLSISRDNIRYMSAAEKYKTKVRARLHMDTVIQSTTPLLH